MRVRVKGWVKVVSMYTWFRSQARAGLGVGVGVGVGVGCEVGSPCILGVVLERVRRGSLNGGI